MKRFFALIRIAVTAFSRCQIDGATPHPRSGDSQSYENTIIVIPRKVARTEKSQDNVGSFFFLHLVSNLNQLCQTSQKVDQHQMLFDQNKC